MALQDAVSSTIHLWRADLCHSFASMVEVGSAAVETLQWSRARCLICLAAPSSDQLSEVICVDFAYPAEIVTASESGLAYLQNGSFDSRG